MFSVDIGNLVGHLRLDDSLWNKTLRSVEHSMTRSLSRIARRTLQFAKYAVPAYIGASIKAFSSFEQELQNVATMLDDQTMKYLPAYGRALREMSVQFGEGTATLSTGLYNILSASIPAAKAMDVLKVSVTAATAGMTDTSTTAYAITGILNAYGMAAEEAGKVSDILFATVKRGQTTFAQLAPSIGRVTSIAATSGVRLEQVAAALATITRAGISTDQAITFLRSSLIALQGKGEDNVRLAKSLGVELSTQSLRTNDLSGMIEKLNKLSEEQFKKIFTDIRSRQALVVLLKAQKGFMYDLNVTMHAAGMTQEAYAKMTDTLAFRLRQLWQVIKYISVAIGDRLSGDVKRLTEYFVKNKDVITDWAVKVIDKISIIGKMFASIFKDFASGEASMRNFVQLIYESLMFLGKVAINIGMRIGKSIVIGIKEGITGETASIQEIFAEYEKITKMFEGKKPNLSFTQPIVNPKTGNVALVDRQLWAMAKVRAEANSTSKAVNALTSDLFKDMEGYAETYNEKIQEIFTNLKKLTAEFEKESQIRGLSRSYQKIKDNLRPVIDAHINIKNIVVDTVKEAFGWKKQTQETVGLFQKIKEILAEIKKTFDSMLGEFGKHLDDITTNFAQDLGSTLSNAFDSAADSLAELLVTGTADFRALLQSIGTEFVRVIIRAQMAELVSKLFPSIMEQAETEKAAAALVTAGTEVSGSITTAGAAASSGMTTAGASVSTAITTAGAQAAMSIRMASAAGNIGGSFLSALFGGGNAGATLGSVSDPTSPVSQYRLGGYGGGFAKGALFNLGKVIPMASGYLFNGPAMLPMANNRTALVGEAGPEVLMPVTRTPSGDLGVKSAGASVENKVKIVNVTTKEQELAALQSEPGEKVIVNYFRKYGLI